jgi:hypothetical protein
LKFYAFQFKSGRHTTSGQPNENTGRLNKAGNLAVFSSSYNRDRWVDAGNITSDMQGNCREAVTAKEARKLHLGMSVSDYTEMVELTTDI